MIQPRGEVVLAICFYPQVKTFYTFENLEVWLTLTSATGFSLWWLLTGSRRPGFSNWALQARRGSSRLLEHRLSGCGGWAQVLLRTRNLPRSGIEPMSRASAGRFMTTGPPGKPFKPVLTRVPLHAPCLPWQRMEAEDYSASLRGLPRTTWTPSWFWRSCLPWKAGGQDLPGGGLALSASLGSWATAW